MSLPVFGNALDGIEPTARCDSCGRHTTEVWPCPSSHCGALLHIECGHGVTHEPVERPYPFDGELVLAQWTCTGCGTIACLDTEPIDDPRVVPFPAQRGR